MEKSNPRARSHTERPAKRLPAPGLETTSAIKQLSASADSGHPRFSARNGHPTRDIRGLEGCFMQRVNLYGARSEAVSGARERPRLTAVFRPFWHGHGTIAPSADPLDANDRRVPGRDDRGS